MNRNVHPVIQLLVAVLLASTFAAAQSIDDYEPVTDEMLRNPPPGDWLMSRRTYNGWGHSPLDQINTENAGDLTLAWAHVMGSGSNEVTPLVHDGVMYLANPNDFIQALDATTGDVIWQYQREQPEIEDRTIIAGLGPVTRTMALYEDKIIHLTNDAFIIALDARTGQLVWETDTGDPRVVGQSAGPLIVEGVAISGRACDPALPGGCYILGHDTESGEELWRTYTIPRPGEPGSESWGDVPLESRLHVGAWGNVGAYDPDLGLVYWGTSVPAPSPEIMRGTVGLDVLYSNSTLALDPQTGEMQWYYQHLPRDNWDFDHPFERMLIDTEVAPDPDEVPWINPDIVPGQEYKTITGIPGKTGIAYSLDRETGEFLWARPTVFQNVVNEIEGDGSVVVNEEKILDSLDDSYGLVCTTVNGGRNWYAGAYNPDTNAFYQGLFNMCMLPEITTDEYTPEDLYGISYPMSRTPGEDFVGTYRAYSASTGELLWQRDQPAAMLSTVSTGGGLVFVGDVMKRFYALDAATGDELWSTILSSTVNGFPITYSVDGEQYVAVAVAEGGGSYLAAQGLNAPAAGNAMFAFKLP